MNSEERQGVYALLPVTIIIRVGNFFMLICEGEVTYRPARRER